MAFLDKFFRKQKEEKLEKQTIKQEKETAKDLELVKKIKESSKTKKIAAKKELKVPIKKDSAETKTVKKDSVKISSKSTKQKFQVRPEDILIRPLITEKVSDMAMYGKYAFKVFKHANKIMVKKAITTLYGVKVKDVKIVNMRGKRVRYGRQWGQQSDWKKAVVTLAPGEKIEIYEGV